MVSMLGNHRHYGDERLGLGFDVGHPPVMFASGTKRKPGLGGLIGLIAGLLILAQACLAHHDVHSPDQSRAAAEALAQIDADLTVAGSRLLSSLLIQARLEAVDEILQTRLDAAEALRTQRCRAYEQYARVVLGAGVTDVERLRCQRLALALRRLTRMGMDPSKETAGLLRILEQREDLRSERDSVTAQTASDLARVESALSDLQTKYPREHPQIRLLMVHHDEIRNRLRALLKDTGESQWSVSTPSDTEAPVSCPGTSRWNGRGCVTN
jgi:hypothetical protein